MDVKGIASRANQKATKKQLPQYDKENVEEKFIIFIISVCYSLLNFSV